MPLITLDVSDSTLWKARSISVTLGVHSLSQLFDQMVEELEWDLYYSPPIQAALHASRVAGKMAATQPGDANQPGDESVISTSKEN